MAYNLDIEEFRVYRTKELFDGLKIKNNSKVRDIVESAFELIEDNYDFVCKVKKIDPHQDYIVIPKESPYYKQVERFLRGEIKEL